MTKPITIFADGDIAGAMERALEASYPAYSVQYRADSYHDCLEVSLRNNVSLFILQAKPPITHLDDLLFSLQSSGISPVYLLFQVYEPGKIRYATTSTTNPMAVKLGEMFQQAMKDRYECELISFRSTLLSENMRPSAESVGRHESLLEILRGCNQKEFLYYRDEFKLNLKDNGYYLFFWELMGVEFTDHESNKYIYNFSGEMLLRECYEIIDRFNGGEVFYSTPNLLCIILNDLDIKSESRKKARFEEMIRKLAVCTGNQVACRYLSERVEEIKGLRYAYERYNAEKSVSFFVRDMIIMRPALIESKKRYTDVRIINALLHEITDFLRYDLQNPALEADLHRLYFDILKPAMSFTLYYSSMAAIVNAMAEVQYSMDNIMPNVNNSPNLLQFTSIEEQYDILLGRIRELKMQKTNVRKTGSSLAMKAVNYMMDNYTRELSVSDISAALFISGVHLSQVFKREMGISVIQYLITTASNRQRSCCGRRTTSFTPSPSTSASTSTGIFPAPSGN
jgi:hypothetical protein